MGLQAEQKVVLRLRAYNRAGAGPWSDELTLQVSRARAGARVRARARVRVRVRLMVTATVTVTASGEMTNPSPNPNPNPNPSPNPIPNQAGTEEERKLVEIDEIPPAWTGLDFSDLPDDDEPNGLKTDQASLGAVRTRLA